jgi:hypothetical protein
MSRAAHQTGQYAQGDDGPTGAVGSMTATDRQAVPPGSGHLSGEAAPARALSVPKRSRAQRVPLNIGVMGDVMSNRYFVSLNLILYYVYMLLHSDVIGATEHKTEWMTAGSEELIPRQVKVNLKIYVFNIYKYENIYIRIYILYTCKTPASWGVVC